MLLGVTAAGTGLLDYQWRLDGSNIPGATNASLRMLNVQLADSGIYSVVVADATGAIVSEPAPLNVLVRPQITVQPESQITLEGDAVTLSVSASGTAPLSYRWRRDGTSIAGATNSVLSFPKAQLGDTATYSVVITNIVSARTLTTSDDAFLVVLADVDKDRIADLWETANGLSATNAGDALLDPTAMD